jgi:2-oxoacid:acceptor oxidoreductase gamma subunit (pyruvate/2-ketoisovalerate family)
MERELMMTGIGGQGVQLAAQILARAAVAEGREVMLFGTYGGMMRGGNTDATLVVGDGPIETPPTIAHAWSAVVMHHDYWEPLQPRLRPGAVVLVNTTVFDRPVDWSPYRLVEVPASDVAVDVGYVQAASMVMIGAYVAATGLVTLGSLIDAVEGSLPSYRAQHRALNVTALKAGHRLVAAEVAPAWPAGNEASVSAVPAGSGVQG